MKTNLKKARGSRVDSVKRLKAEDIYSHVIQPQENGRSFSSPFYDKEVCNVIFEKCSLHTVSLHRITNETRICIKQLRKGGQKLAGT